MKKDRLFQEKTGCFRKRQVVSGEKKSGCFRRIKTGCSGRGEGGGEIKTGCSGCSGEK